MMLTDAVIDELVTEAGRVGLLWVGIDRQQMLAALYDIREDMKTKLAHQLGTDAADMVAQSFVAAVVGVRDAIEAEGNIQRGTLQ
jgi:hypothetical protein